jgi:hypothetical protein
MLIRVASRALIESSRVYTSLHRLIIEPNSVFMNSSFNNQFEHESSLFKAISSKLTNSSARLRPYLQVLQPVLRSFNMISPQVG